MPLLIERGGSEHRWTGEGYERADAKVTGNGAGRLDIALLNNMPDAAVEDTELQFFGLIGAAAGRVMVHAKLYSIPTVPRGERTQTYLDANYSKLSEMLGRRFDGVIITGTEPKQADLRKEPYWGSLAEVLDWAEENTSSTVLSCLAAHAGVLYSDGIGRNPLGDKQFGVFSHEKQEAHALTHKVNEPVRIPHSRWNEVREGDLRESGYEILTKSPEAGVDLFVKEKKQSLFVHFQGHPEYGGMTLFKEYRRDVRRYLRKERETYPQVPHDYFGGEAVQLLEMFQGMAMANRREDVMENFPEADVTDTLQNKWRESATSVYGNWLQLLMQRKLNTPVPVAMARAGQR